MLDENLIFLPLENFFERRFFIFEDNKKSSDLSAPTTGDPPEEAAWVFCLSSASAFGFFLRFILLTLMCDCPVGINAVIRTAFPSLSH